MRWRCLEPGCEAVVEAATEEDLVEAANSHMRDAHETYELEEVILAGAEDTDRSATGVENTDRSAT